MMTARATPSGAVGSVEDRLGTFDHVVVLMLENRSFDNLLGYMYPHGVPPDAPAGKTFDGVTGKDLSNPIPQNLAGSACGAPTSVSVSPTTDYFQPFPDPGEEYHHINTQLFNCINGGDKSPYNLPNPVPSRPGMQGFVTDYIETLKATGGPYKNPTYEQFKVIMDCFKPSAVPVLTGLAEEFAVFDHWFCSVPSQTWCNRCFWNAGTSWGHVNNGGAVNDNSERWAEDSIGTTIFNQIEDSGLRSPLNWKVYSSNLASLTGIIHFRALLPYHVFPDHFRRLESFYDDCERGKLPAYSFLEPNFWTPHNDMHPSSYDSKHYGPAAVGSVLLGEKLVWDVYNAVRRSASTKGNNSRNTLLIITFDEHGGCYDHVPPPPKVTPPDLSGYKKWSDFGFTRLGLRVPTVMVSAHIKKNTVINTPMEHCSFLKTMQTKWNGVVPGKFPTLTRRQQHAPEFTEVFTSPAARLASDWPELPEPVIPDKFQEIDFSTAPLNDLQRSIVGAIAAIAEKQGMQVDPAKITTQNDALELMGSVPKLPGSEPTGKAGE
ncbi:MAG: alkaline phosphatase family protein [Phycisphaerae bacterium]|jgi:phospholipase C